MLCLKVTSPGYLVIEFVIVLLKKLYSLCIGHTAKLRINHMVQSVQKPLINKRIEEVHLLRCILQHKIDHILQHSLCQIHIILKISKCTLRLDHPELCCKADSIRLNALIKKLCTEGRSKGIYIAECLCKSLTVQLSADSKVGLFSEEVLAVIDLPLIIYRCIYKVKCSDLEHLSCTLTVTSCDQWCMHIYETSLLEELMNRICCQGTYTEYCLECICSRS